MAQQTQQDQERRFVGVASTVGRFAGVASTVGRFAVGRFAGVVGRFAGRFAGVASTVGRFAGVASTVAGLICYALSSSSNNLIGKWSLLKIFAYIVSSSTICLLAFLPKTRQQNLRILHRYRTLFSFLVLISTTVYSFYLDRKSTTKPDACGLISSAAFATASLCISKQIECGFLDLMYFFCGLLIGQLMEIKPLLAFVGIGFTGFLIILRSYLNARSCTCYVFLSFSEDIRNGIIDRLCVALAGKGIKTFMNDKDLEGGEVISSPMLLKAIEESMLAITVLSPNYAFSTSCLDELSKIVDWRHKLHVVPVFYGISPPDVRYQRGSFGEALKRHEERFGQDSEKVKLWRDALRNVANLAGFDFKGRHEATVVESIAEQIHKYLIKSSPM